MASEARALLQRKKAPCRDLTPLGCYINMVRFNMGPGMLSLPFAFADAGLLLSLSLGVPMVLLCIFSMNLLIFAKRAVLQQKELATSIDSGCEADYEAAQYTEVTFTEIGILGLGPFGGHVVDMSIMSAQFGICVVYHAFIATNLATCFPILDARWTILLVMPVVAALSLVRSPGKLVIFSTLGNFLMGAGLCIVLGNLALKVPDGWTQLTEQSMFNWSRAPAFTSTIIFSFEGVTCIIALEQAMIKPSKFLPALTAGSSTVGLVYFIFATTCLAGLGGVVSSGTITAALQGRVSEGWLLACNLIIAGAVTVTYPLQFFPAMDVVEQHLAHRWSSCLGHHRTNMVRIGVSVTCGLLAVAVPQINLLVNLVGSLGNPVLGLILPPIIHMRCAKPRPPAPMLCLDLLCLLLGLYGLSFGLYSSTVDIAHSLSPGASGPP